MTFGHALKTLRRSKEVSQRELAARVNIDFSYISKIENDRMQPPAADTIEKLCEALGATANERDQLLAMTGKVPSSMKETLGTSPAALQFMREAVNLDLSEQEWDILKSQLKSLREP